MATEQERWNQAQQNTGNVTRGTQPHAAAQAQKNTGNALHGTYPGNQPKAGFGDQAGHDKAYQNAMKGHQAMNPGKKPTPGDDVKVAQGMLNAGADPKKLQNSVAGHSPNVGKLDKGGRDKYGGDVVAVAGKRNAQDQPRDPRQNIKPGHETNRGPDPKPPSPSPSGGGAAKPKEPSASQSAQMAAWHQSQNRGR